MSRSKRDQRGRLRSGKKCPEAAAGGCVYCRTGQYKHNDSRTKRYSKRRMVRESLGES